MMISFDGNGDLVIRDDADGEGKPDTLARWVPGAMMKGGWNHVAVVCDGREVKVYINGVVLGRSGGL